MQIYAVTHHMPMSLAYRVLLYYQYVPVDDPKQLRDDQRALCERLHILGRILVGSEGINGTVAGTTEEIEEYKKATWADPRFADMVFKEDESDFLPFRKLKVKVRPEIVTLGERAADAHAENTGKKLSPDEWHEMIQRDDVVVVDARNNYESRIGKFPNAITPDIDTFSELPEWVDEHKEELQGKPVLMYCNGDIRCERSSAYVKQVTGNDEVYHLDGGIVTYTKEKPDGLWQGSLYVFDDRVTTQLNDDEHHVVIGRCDFCDTACDTYYNCGNAVCNKRIILCDACRELSNESCSEDCSTKHRTGIQKPWRISERAIAERSAA